MRPNSQTITESEMLELLGRQARLPPLEIRLVAPGDLRSPADAVVQVTWDDRVFEFDAELKARSTPRVFEAAVRQARGYAEGSGRYPMIVLPYLRREQLDLLEREQISGIDLCGNGLVMVPGQLLVYRSGEPNRYRESIPTKYAYRGTTSLVPRVFLCRREFEAVGQIKEEIRARGGAITLATVSKALKRLQEDVLIDRRPDGIRLLQPDALLDKLIGSYREPKLLRRVPLALDRPLETALASLTAKPRSVLSGASSASQYAVVGRSDRPILCCENVDEILAAWRDEARQTERLADLELRETRDPTVFFDIRTKNGVPYASPIQAYLELASGEKRDREAAEQVKQRILDELDRD